MYLNNDQTKMVMNSQIVKITIYHLCEIILVAVEQGVPIPLNEIVSSIEL